MENDAPGTEYNGAVYIVGSAPTGAFSTFSEHDIALFEFGSWYAWAPPLDTSMVVNDVRKVFDGTEWVDDPSIGSGWGDTDDVPEGATNLYFTDERAQDAVEGMFDPAGSAAAALLAATTYTDDQLDPVNTKLATIEDGATVGADWSVNLTNIPENITSWAGIAPTAKADRAPINVSDWNADIGAGTGTEFGTGTGAAANAPSASGLLATSIKRSGTVGFMLGGAFSADQLWYRRMTGGAWQPWVRVWDTSNFDPATKADAATVAVIGASALVYPTAGLNVPSGAATSMIFGASAHDQIGAWNPASPTRLTCSVAGWYRVSFTARFNALAGGSRFAYANKNGSAAYAGRPSLRIPPSGGIDYVSAMSAVIQCAAGDYFELILSQDSGSSILSPGALPESNWFCLERVR